MINTVIFDLDGTLLDTNELVADSWRFTVRTLAGREVTDEEVRGTFGEILLDSMLRLLPGVEPDKALDTFRTYQRDIFLERISLYDGAKETLAAIHLAGIKNAVLTSRLRTSTERALNHFGIADLFDAVLTASDTEVFKPDPAPVYLLLDMLGSRAEEAMIVGDTVHDIEAGLASGLFTVLVDWSQALPPEKRQAAPAPDAVIEKMQDLLKLLRI